MRHGDRPLTIGLDLTGDAPVRKVIRLRDVLPAQPAEIPSWLYCDRCGSLQHRDLMTIKSNGEVEYLRLCESCADLYPRTVREIDAVPHDWAQETRIETPVEELLVHIPGHRQADIDRLWDVDDERPDVLTKFCEWDECDSQPLEWGKVGEYIPTAPNQKFCGPTHRRYASRLKRWGLRPEQTSHWIEKRKRQQEEADQSPTINTLSSPEQLRAWAKAKEEEHDEQAR